jgi:putative transposase
MSNHVHLLVTPLERGATSAMLQDLGRKYVRIINTVHGRTGTLWEGRYKASLVADDRYLLACHRYIELNPVRAGMVVAPGEHPWSSYRHYACGRPDSLITPHRAYMALGESNGTRQNAFRALCSEESDTFTLKAIRDALNAGCQIGSEIRKRGRPKRSDVVDQTQSGNLL